MEINPMIFPPIPDLFIRDNKENVNSTCQVGSNREMDGIYSNRLILGWYSNPVFSIINSWKIFAKVEGTHIEIHYSPEIPSPYYKIKGKTEDLFVAAEIAAAFQIAAALKDKICKETLCNIFSRGKGIIFGVIQKILDEYVFFVFDILRGDNRWLDRTSIEILCEELKLNTVPLIGSFSLEGILKYMLENPNPKWHSDDENQFYYKKQLIDIKGIVGRPFYELVEPNLPPNYRLVFQLKFKDVQDGYRQLS